VPQIRVTSQGKSRNYISYGTNLLTDKGYSFLVLKAMGKAINKTVTIGAPGGWLVPTTISACILQLPSCSL
jgi:hypothetical protein